MQPFLPLHDRAPQLPVVTTSPGACPKHAPHALPQCPVNDAWWTRRPPPALPRSPCCLPSLPLCTRVRAHRRRFIEQLAGPTRRDLARQARTLPTSAPLQNPLTRVQMLPSPPGLANHHRGVLPWSIWSVSTVHRGQSLLARTRASVRAYNPSKPVSHSHTYLSFLSEQPAPLFPVGKEEPSEFISSGRRRGHGRCSPPSLSEDPVPVLSLSAPPP
jgi:hypothetical protein